MLKFESLMSDDIDRNDQTNKHTDKQSNILSKIGFVLFLGMRPISLKALFIVRDRDSS